MAILHFQKAIREGAKIIGGIYGESGSGKTYSALKLARGLVGPNGKIAVIDTERGRAKIYANIAAPWDHAELTPPFSPERYIEALAEAETANYNAVVIDSMSHAWGGIGGVLDIAEENPKLRGKGLIQWAGPKSRHKKLVNALVRSNCHLLLCLRAKEDIKQRMAKDEKGIERIVIESHGFIPIQEKRFIFEVTFQLFLPLGERRGVPVVQKCPEDLLLAFPAGEQISEQTGARIRQWLEGAAPVDRALEKLKREAEDAAELGMVKLRDMWEGLERQQKAALKPYMDNLKNIAAEADRRIAEEHRRSMTEEGDEPTFDTDEVPAEKSADERLDNPFGLPPLPGEKAAK